MTTVLDPTMASSIGDAVEQLRQKHDQLTASIVRGQAERVASRAVEAGCTDDEVALIGSWCSALETAALLLDLAEQLGTPSARDHAGAIGARVAAVYAQQAANQEWWGGDLSGLIIACDEMATALGQDNG